MKLFCVLLVALMLVGCTQQDDISGIPTSGCTPEMADAETTTNLLNRILEENEFRLGFSKEVFSDGYTYENLEQVAVYRTYKWLGPNTNENVILLDLKDSNRYQIVNLGAYSTLRIDRVRSSPDSDILWFDVCDGIFGQGKEGVFRSFVTSIQYSISRNEVIGSIEVVGNGTYGNENILPAVYQFGSCTLIDNQTLVLTFEHLPTDQISYALNSPPIIISQSAQEETPMVFQFKDTSLNLSMEFIASVSQLEGAKSVELEQIDTPAFTGTQLTIIPEEHYIVSCRFNQSGTVGEFEDFSVFCMQDTCRAVSNSLPNELHNNQ